MEIISGLGSYNCNFVFLMITVSSHLHSRRTLHCQPLSPQLSVSVNTSSRPTADQPPRDYCCVNCLKCFVGYEPLPPPRPAAIAAPVWQDRTIASAKLRLLEYAAFMETQRDRETVNILRFTCAYNATVLFSKSEHLSLLPTV